jgi:polar amino acid transport system substrate-binding protein
VVRKDEQRFTTIEEFAAQPRLILGVQTGTVEVDEAHHYLPDSRIRLYDETSINFYALAMGDVDAILMDNIEFQNSGQAITGTGKQFEMIGPAIQENDLGIPMMKSSALVQPVNLALADLPSSGVLTDLYNKYFSGEIALTYQDIGLGAYAK